MPDPADPPDDESQPTTSQSEVLQFLDACRELQSGAAHLARDPNLDRQARKFLRELRILLLSTRKALMPAAKQSTSSPAER